MIKREFWRPTLTSQFPHCPIPYRFDSYRGCVFQCQYCFARSVVLLNRRHDENKEFEYLIGNDPLQLENYIEKAMSKPINYKRSDEVAIKERIPIKLGSMADPFPPVERKEKITYDILKIFHKYDYPIMVQTKNPVILAEYSQDFINPNWTVAVSLISMDEAFVKKIEPNSPKSADRINAIKKLTSEGKNVFVKVQPAIYPKILEDLPELVKAIKDSGAFGFNIEGLKIKKAMKPEEVLLFDSVNQAVGYDVRNYYKTHGIRTGSDYEMSKTKKLEYIHLCVELAKKYNLKFYVADNNMGKIGCGDECCGTEVLRNYKKWGNNNRTLAFETPNEKHSQLLGECIVNDFVMSSCSYRYETLNNAMKKLFKEKQETLF